MHITVNVTPRTGYGKFKASLFRKHHLKEEKKVVVNNY